ncbi:hypothetical protein FACS1894142_3800 [Spirochaetia bacterium]|nr:hypothetical protein FACS1894142_3800 [Spirochaetia bacterium]
MSFILIVITTVYLLVSVYYLNETITPLNVIVRYAAAIIGGILVEKSFLLITVFSKIIEKNQEKPLKLSAKLWIKIVFLYGVIGLGCTFCMGMLFTFFCIIPDIELVVTEIKTILPLSLIGGFLSVNILLLCLVLLKAYKKRRNNCEKKYDL